MKSRIFSRRRNIGLILLFVGVVCTVLIIYLSFTKERRRKKTLRSHHQDINIEASGADDLGGDRWMRYHPPVQSGIKVLGKRFEFGDHVPKWISRSYVTMTSQSAQNFVIATAASAIFYPYALSAMETVQRHLPNRRIIVYDLELTVDAVVAEKFNNVCGVTYRQFNFSQYPEHTKTLANYAWKPLIITELLYEYPGVFWIDSSIRLMSSNFRGIFAQAVRSDGMLALTSTGHSNYAVTHPQTYDYLPTSIDQMVAVDQHEANCVLVYRTRQAVENVLWWWRLCALDPRCIAPTMRLHCVKPYMSRNTWARCHRFDQSALNILLANYFAFDSTRYFASSSHRVSEVRRGSVSSGNVGVCGSKPKASSVAKISDYFSEQF